VLLIASCFADARNDDMRLLPASQFAMTTCGCFVSVFLAMTFCC
jgi:hypothetical protein